MANTTTSTEGCCYLEKGNVDTRKESCTSVNSEEECLEVGMLGNTASEANSCAVGMSRRMGMTRTVLHVPRRRADPTGCCFGSMFRTQSKCEEDADRLVCERKRCTWLETDDPTRCRE